jgi:Ca2+-dependent lipid-binding protein
MGVDSNGKSSDAFVKLFLGKSDVKSKTVKKTLNPVWNEFLEIKC